MPTRASERRPAPREPLSTRLPYAAAALALAVGLWLLARLGALPVPPPGAVAAGAPVPAADVVGTRPPAGPAGPETERP